MTHCRSRMAAGAVAALASSVLLACARPERGPAGAVREGAMAAYPKESVGLVVIEVDKLRKVKPEARWLESVATDPAIGGPLGALRDRFGADLLGTITRLSLAIVPQEEHRVSYGMMVERRPGSAAAKAGGANDAIVPLASAGGPADLNATALPDGTLVIGPRAVLEVVRGNAAHPGSGLGTSPGMTGPLDRLPGGAHIWGAVDFKTLQQLAREAAQSRGSTLPSIPDNPTVNTIVSLGFHGKVGKTLDFGLMGETTGEKEAKNLADTARALLALARAGVNKDQKPEWLELLDSMSVDQKGQEVTLKGILPEKTLDAIASQARAAAAENAPVSGAPAASAPSTGKGATGASAPQATGHPAARTGP